MKKTNLRKPKARGVWKINPKTRVEKSKKTYARPAEKRKAHRTIERIDWFGDK